MTSDFSPVTIIFTSFFVAVVFGCIVCVCCTIVCGNRDKLRRIERRELITGHSANTIPVSQNETAHSANIHWNHAHENPSFCSVINDTSSTQLETYQQDCAMNDPPPSYDAVMSSVMSQNPNVSWSTNSRYVPFPYWRLKNLNLLNYWCYRPRFSQYFYIQNVIPRPTICCLTHYIYIYQCLCLW